MARKMRDSGVEWIGEVPEGWEFLRNKWCFSCSKSIVGKASETTQLLSLTTSGVKCKGKEVIGGKLPESFDTYQEVSQNDLILCLFDMDCSAVFSGLSRFDGMISPAYKVMKCKRCIEPKYADYWFDFVGSQRFFKPYAKNIRYSLTFDEFADLMMIVPPLPEQRRIADYLDEKCAAIDGAVDELKHGIEDCKAWKKAIIEETVFSGLRHKESVETGDDWLISIPSSWGFEQIRYLFALRDERNDKPLSEVNLISLYTDQGVVQHCDLEKTTGNKASTADGYKIVKENDIVVNIILCWMGAIGRSAYNGVTSPAYDVYQPIDESRVLSRYYHYLFRTSRFNGKCYQEGRGIMMMRWRTYSSEFRAIKVPVPPMKEQQAIADYLDEKCAAIDALVAEKEKLIADLEAYKKSLIFELVTGKREVA